MTSTWAQRLPAATQFLSYVRTSAVGHRVLKGAFWSVVGTAISRAAALLGSIVVARVLGKAGFGQFGIVQSTILMFGTVAGVGLGTTATKYVAEFRSTDPDRAGRVIALARSTSWVVSGAIALLLFTAADLLARRTLNAPELAPQLRIGSLLLLFSGINGAQTGALSGFEAFRSIARINVLVGLLSFPLMAAGVYFGGLTGAVWALTANVAVNCVFNSLTLRSEMQRCAIPKHSSGTLKELSILWNFSLPAILVSMVVSPTIWLCSTILATSPAGYEGMGAFSAAMQWRNMIVLVPSLLAGVAMPALSNLHGTKDVSAYRKVLLLNLGLTAAVAGALTIGVLIAAAWIAAGYGRGFADAAPVMRLLAISGFLYALNTVAGVAISSLGRVWTGLLFVSFCYTSMIVSAYLLVPRYGAFGLALSHAIAYLLHAVWQGGFIYRVLTYRAL